jgi:hypothetical protein
MDDSVLWAAAFLVGALGLSLLIIGGVAAMYLSTDARKGRGAASSKSSPSLSGDADSGDESPSSRGNGAAAEEAGSRVDSPDVQRAATGGLWTWIKAGLFAVLHAGTVSLVLGGITFFEDLAKASDEIQSSGTVTFPKQLLPGALYGPASRKRLSHPAGNSMEDEEHPGDGRRYDEPEDGAGNADVDQSGASGWEVVDLVGEAGAEGDG